MLLKLVPRIQVAPTEELTAALRSGRRSDLKRAEEIAMSGKISTLAQKMEADVAVSFHHDKARTTRGIKGYVADIRLDRVHGFRSAVTKKLEAEQGPGNRY